MRSRRRGRRPDCAGDWQYDSGDVADYWPGPDQFGPGDGPCQYHDSDDRDD